MRDAATMGSIAAKGANTHVVCCLHLKIFLSAFQLRLAEAEEKRKLITFPHQRGNDGPHRR
jgi:hypothetical protein